MKKVLLLVFCGILVLFASCTTDRNSSRPNFPAENAAGAGKVLRLVTDLGMTAEHFGFPSDTLSAQYAVDQAFELIGGLPEGCRVEVEVLPLDEADYQSRLTRLRTEIMSGQGPDIFALATDFLDVERLFPDPNKAMLDGYFLKLDDYVERAEFMELDKMNSAVMDAGRTAEGRFVLPMRYTFGYSLFYEPVTDPKAGWWEVMNGEDRRLAQAYATTISFHEIFPEPVDYKTGTLTFSEKELYDYFTAAFALNPPWNGPAWTEVVEGFLQGSVPVRVPVSGDPYWNPDNKETDTYLPARDLNGGVPATVTAYLAINKNTPYPEEAFRVADVLMSKKFQSGGKFWETGGGTSDVDKMIPVFSAADGVSVYDELMQKTQPLNSIWYIENEMFPTYCELRDQITCARMLSAVDQVLDELKRHALETYMTMDDDLEKYVSQAYAKMVLLAGEL